MYNFEPRYHGYENAHNSSFWFIEQSHNIRPSVHQRMVYRLIFKPMLSCKTEILGDKVAFFTKKSVKIIYSYGTNTMQVSIPSMLSLNIVVGQFFAVMRFNVSGYAKY